MCIDQKGDSIMTDFNQNDSFLDQMRKKHRGGSVIEEEPELFAAIKDKEGSYRQ